MIWRASRRQAERDYGCDRGIGCASPCIENKYWTRTLFGHSVGHITTEPQSLEAPDDPHSTQNLSQDPTQQQDFPHTRRCSVVVPFHLSARRSCFAFRDRKSVV